MPHRVGCGRRRILAPSDPSPPPPERCTTLCRQDAASRRASRAGARRARRTRGAGSRAGSRADGHRPRGPPRRNDRRRHDPRSRRQRPDRGPPPAATSCTAAPAATPSSGRPAPTASRSRRTARGTRSSAASVSTSSTPSTTTWSPTTARSSPGSSRAIRSRASVSTRRRWSRTAPRSARRSSPCSSRGASSPAAPREQGWATSVDAGRTWRRGFLERVDDRASDPVVAYDRLHRTWLIATLGVNATRRVVASARQPLDRRARLEPPGARRGRRGRGLRQGVARLRHVDVEPVLRPVLPRVPRRPDPARSAHGARPTAAARGPSPVAAPVPSPDYRGNGAYPVIRPDGALLVFFSVFGSIDPDVDSIQMARSRRRRRDVRAVPPGRIACSPRTSPGCVRRPSCRRTSMPAARSTRPGPTAGSARSARRTASSSSPRATVSHGRSRVVSRSGRSRPRRPVRPRARGRSLDACSREASRSSPTRRRSRTAAPRARSSTPSSCGRATAATTWRPPARLNAESIPLGWVADTGLGRMLADYVSVSYVGGRPVPVLSLATEPEAGELRQSIYATTRAP